jgi:hypothetical protein
MGHGPACFNLQRPTAATRPATSLGSWSSIAHSAPFHASVSRYEFDPFESGF